FIVNTLLQEFIFFLYCQKRPRVISHDIHQRNMAGGRNQIGSENNGFILILQHRKHLFFGMSVYKNDIHFQIRSETVITGCRKWKKIKLSAFLHWQNVFFQKTCSFPWVRFGSPLPVIFIGPELSIGERGTIAISFIVPFHRSSTMIKMKVS